MTFFKMLGTQKIALNYFMIEYFNNAFILYFDLKNGN